MSGGFSPPCESGALQRRIVAEVRRLAGTDGRQPRCGREGSLDSQAGQVSGAVRVYRSSGICGAIEGSARRRVREVVFDERRHWRGVGSNRRP